MHSTDQVVYSTDLCTIIHKQIEEANGDVELVLCRMFAPPCYYLTAREWSVKVAHCFGMNEVEFMKTYYRLRKVATQRLKAASSEARTDASNAGDSGSR
jgi:hypothetical protein